MTLYMIGRFFSALAARDRVKESIERLIEGQAFFVVVWFGPTPTLSPPPLNKLYRRHTGRLRKRGNLLMGGYRDILYTNILYTWQSLYELSLYGTEFIRDKVYTWQSLYRDKVYTRTKFIRGQSLYGTKFIQWQSLYGDKVYTNFFHTVCLN